MSTQWTAQFLVASELSRRGYTVAFTNGNYTPVADLMVGAPSGKLFWVDVKGLARRNPWLIRNQQEREGLYYILTALARMPGVGESRSPDRFFILSHAQVTGLLEDYRRRHPGDQLGRPGFGYDDPVRHENAWQILPT